MIFTTTFYDFSALYNRLLKAQKAQIWLVGTQGLKFATPGIKGLNQKLNPLELYGGELVARGPGCSCPRSPGLPSPWVDNLESRAQAFGIET